MKRLVFLVAAMCLCSSTVLSGSTEYQCLITESLDLDDRGKLTRPPRPVLLGKRFAVDRNTGYLVGPETMLWSTASSKYVVLARGNSDNSFTVLISDEAAKDGMHTTLLRVEEFSPGAKKPFVVLSGSQVASGICE